VKVLVIGSGGREHTLCWKLAQSQKLDELYCAPGNAGIAQVAKCIQVSAEDIPQLRDFAKLEEIDLTVVGPEAPLVEGIVDVFQEEGLKVFGPTKKAAQLEGSKAFAKRFMQRHGIPTAKFGLYEEYNDALFALKQYRYPLVIKASGLAAGKGVIICKDKSEAESTLKDIMIDNRFGEAGSEVVVEEYLKGEEASILAITDGEVYFCLTPSQDHKRLMDGDQGPNTGGMGAYAPAPVITPHLQERIEQEVLKPTLGGLMDRDTRYAGCLYLGLMITEDGPKVLEYNCRFGDPETQAVLPLLNSDLLELMAATIDGTLGDQQIEFHDGAAACVVMASGGYPGKYEKGKVITGFDEVPEDVVVFHAGTAEKEGKIVTSGGRVLGVTGVGPTFENALDLAYMGVDAIEFEDKFYRKDIGKKALLR
jgi:phosphoribosylamine--glycine ligase